MNEAIDVKFLYLSTFPSLSMTVTMLKRDTWRHLNNKLTSVWKIKFDFSAGAKWLCQSNNTNTSCQIRYTRFPRCRCYTVSQYIVSSVFLVFIMVNILFKLLLAVVHIKLRDIVCEPLGTDSPLFTPIQFNHINYFGALKQTLVVREWANINNPCHYLTHNFWLRVWSRVMSAWLHICDSCFIFLKRWLKLFHT